MSFSAEEHSKLGAGAPDDAAAYEPTYTSRTSSVPSQHTITTCSPFEDIDRFFEPSPRRVFEEAETRLQPILRDIRDLQQATAMDAQTMFRGHPIASQMSQAQEIMYGGSSFSWYPDHTQIDQANMHYSMHPNFTPALGQRLPAYNLVQPSNINAQFVQSRSGSYGSWDAVDTMDNNARQRTPGELQRSYMTEGYPSTQPHAFSHGHTRYPPTGASQTELLSEDNSSALMHINGATPLSSRLATPSDSNPDDGTSSGNKANPIRRPLTPERRRNAKIMREVGSCIRCRIMKTTCDKGNPCARCADVLGKARTYHAPCSRDKLGEVCLARQGNSEFDQEIMSFRNYQWKYMWQTKTLQLSWTLPNGRGFNLPQLIIECREFVPGLGDVVSAQWQDKGRVTVLSLPTYACHDKHQLLQAVGGFLEAGRTVLENEMLDGVTDELESLTLKEAYRVSRRDQSGILLLALRIRANTILSAGWGTPVGEETLGIPELANAIAGHVGDRPLPPAIDHQIDVAIWETIQRDQELLIKELKKRLFQQAGRKPWLEMFLTFFVSLSNVQYVHGQAMSWMKSQQQTDAAVPVTYQVKKMMDRWNWSAQNILHHFRSTFRGDLPLVAAQKNLGDFIARECLDSESVVYVKSVLHILRDQGENLLRQTMGSALGQVTESGDHWTRHLFMHQYQKIG